MSELLLVTSGRGPVECCRAVALLSQALLAEAAASGLQAAVLESSPGPQDGTLSSVLLLLDGGGADLLAAGVCGTVRWVCPSPYRPGHSRKNWHVGVCRLTLPELPAFDERDVRFETCRSGGSGGQHVNTTDSAVRAVHVATGLTTVARGERSQHQNRRQALRQLQAMVEYRRRSAEREAEAGRWGKHNELERGNPVRVYRGTDFVRTA